MESFKVKQGNKNMASLRFGGGDVEFQKKKKKIAQRYPPRTHKYTPMSIKAHGLLFGHL